MRSSAEGSTVHGEIGGREDEVTPDMIAKNKKKLLDRARAQREAHENAVKKAQLMGKVAGEGGKSAADVLDEAGDALRRSNELAAARRRVITAGGEQDMSAS